MAALSHCQVPKLCTAGLAWDQVTPPSHPHRVRLGLGQAPLPLIVESGYPLHSPLCPPQALDWDHQLDLVCKWAGHYLSGPLDQKIESDSFYYRGEWQHKAPEPISMMRYDIILNLNIQYFFKFKCTKEIEHFVKERFCQNQIRHQKK